MIACAVVGLIFLFLKTPLPGLRLIESERDGANAKTHHASMWSHKEFVTGVITLLFYVAAQVGVGAFFINLTVETWPNATSQNAAYYLSIAMLAFMAGRFITTALMIKINAVKLLCIYAVINAILCAVILIGCNYISVIAAIGIFFFMSIMFPTIFAMGVKNLGSHTKMGSSYMIMAIVGGAILPYFMGRVSDAFGTHYSYGLPLVCFLIVVAYSISYRKLAA